MDQLDSGTQASKIKFDTRIGVVRNRSVEWVVKGYKAINNVDLVKKADKFSPRTQAWEMCRVPGTSFNFSHASLDSEEARQALNALVRDDPTFYAEITSGKSEDSVPDESETTEEDQEDTHWDVNNSDGDDLSLSTNVVVARTMRTGVDRDDEPEETSDAEDSDSKAEYSDADYKPTTRVKRDTEGKDAGPSEIKRSGRTRVPNQRYEDAIRVLNSSDDESKA
ncbi:hypothetical protein BC629DRAFT_1487215 [Irpex lacteus]|nr:hypothetical protein BC629DRAFT_1487215 [Irpex lacteus]